MALRAWTSGFGAWGSGKEKYETTVWCSVVSI